MALSGAHQYENLATALSVLEALRAQGVGLTPDAVAAGVAAARWPARVERLGDVIFDAAHNPDGIEALVRALPDLSPLGRSAITVAGCAGVALVAALGDGVIRGAWPDWAAIGPTEIAGLAMFGIGSMAISQLLWIISVGRIGIGAASMHMNAVPFYTMLMVFSLGGC